MSIRRSTAVFAVVLAAVVTACGEKKIEKAELEQKAAASGQPIASEGWRDHRAGD